MYEVIKMREITKAISEFFEGTAIENALELGISNVLAFGNETFCREDEGITLFVSDSYEEFCGNLEEKGITLNKAEPLICSMLHKDFNPEELMSVLRQLVYFPEGTTVIFTHNDDIYEAEKLLNGYGFRTVEHFSADRVADFFIKTRNLSERNYYCLCVRK